MHKILRNLLIYVVVLSIYSEILDGSVVEDTLETQIDPRLPKSFPGRSMTLQTRGGFIASPQYTYTDKSSGEIKTGYIGNFEKFALDYWYETRVNNFSCDYMIPTGLAASCDWALMVPCLFGDVTKPPRTIYVNTMMLPHFLESTLEFLPKINNTWNFIVISGGTDRSVPRNALDSRYYRAKLRGFVNTFDDNYQDYFFRLVNHPQVAHWYAENRDRLHPKFSSVPTGYCVDHPDDWSFVPKHILPLHERPLMFMNADRVRDGAGQWADRAHVATLCSNFTQLCLRQFGGVFSATNHSDFIDHLVTVPFILCVHGGGIDPSPKAFEAIIVGTIPIIQRSPYIEDSYGHLPVAWIDSWDDLFTNVSSVTAILQKWLTDLSPYYVEGSALRRQTLHRLKTEYWLEKMNEKLIEYEENTTRHRHHSHDRHF